MHLDVKQENFLIALNEDQSERNYAAGTEIPCKIIDFNTSVISNLNHSANIEFIAAGIRAREIFQREVQHVCKNYI